VSTLKRFLNYFTSTYTNDTKYHHSKLGFLRIFFERNNKFTSYITNLGNVFRNSKWSDLNIQNIKPSFISSQTGYFIVLTILLFLFLKFFGNYTINFITAQFPFTIEIVNWFVYTWSQIQKSWESFLLSIYGIFSCIKMYITSYLTQKKNYVYNAISSNKNKTSVKIEKKYNLSKTSTKSISKTSTKSKNDLESSLLLVFSFENLSKDLDLIRNSNLSASFFNKFNTHNKFTTSILIDNSAKLHYDKQTLLLLSNFENFYGQKSIKLINAVQLNSTITSLYALESKSPAFSLITNNVSTILANTKEKRWFSKNSLLSENLIINSWANTQSKKLLGLNVLNSNNTSKNVWNSTKLNNLNKTNSSHFVKNLQNFWLHTDTNLNNTLSFNQIKPSLNNFNIFENSRFWLTKKYYTNNQLKEDLTTLNTINSVSLSNKTTKKNNIDFNINSSILDLNFNNQTNNLSNFVKKSNLDLIYELEYDLKEQYEAFSVCPHISMQDLFNTNDTNALNSVMECIETHNLILNVPNKKMNKNLFGNLNKRKY